LFRDRQLSTQGTCSLLSERHYAGHSGGARSQTGAHPGSLKAAATPEELNHPGYRLHPLKGQWKGFWSVWVNANWRVTFRFTGNDVELVDYVDYH
jgi:plasmid maintenance system killer protein